ncbi:uncharacterized protein LOC100826940 isoform X2 [Brachypodium distachyon]|uniref:BHLH domain-containing protein n=1 Tax=Brachypodium distachyon TaxID=15368 RepID=A0A2K2DTQ3_BRADI|nr:uncharacterized protein LOC100826940 isoform X2 [Brachypodium distachyon]PNT77654.1 hypothetical protein BRADI_1g66345v3 [Brachypodium distachyon]|eukprot:XP_010228790.1 uncharacterized protein LOC100826940 isoform X2 [Brachypodium distachyon]
MWNCSAPSSLLLPFSDDYVKCESSTSSTGTAGFDKILAADYDLCHRMSLPPPSFQSLPAPTLFATRSSESYFGTGDSLTYNGPAFMQFSYTQPTPAANHLVRWTAAGGEPMTGEGSSFRGSKRLKTTAAAATTQGPQHRLQCRAKPRNQAMKAPCKRSQKLGDKITALQQLVSPYGKTDTASVLHEAAACIRSLHDQIQILAAPYPGLSSSPSPSSSQDAGEEPGAASLRRRGLCLMPLSPAVASLVSEAARGRGHAHTDMEEDAWFGAL